MKIKLLARCLVILLFIFTTACQRQVTATESRSSVQPGFNPLATSMPTNAVDYPAGNQLLSQTQESTSKSYPATTSGASPTSTIQQPTSSPSIVVATASFENIQSGQYYPLECSKSGDLFKCKDDQLGMMFSYPSGWGHIKGELVTGRCGGFYYGYVFDPFNVEVQAGGVSKDFCRPMGGDFFSLFKGYDPGHGCNEFPGAQDCKQVHDRVVIASLYPTFQAICEPGPGSVTTPMMVVGISIPGNHSTSGLVFAIDFLSSKGKEQLFAPFGGVMMDLGKCQDPNTGVHAKVVRERSLR